MLVTKKLTPVEGLTFSFKGKRRMVDIFKDALSELKTFLATEIPLKAMKNALCFTSNALFILKIFKILSWLFWSYRKTG